MKKYLLFKIFAFLSLTILFLPSCLEETEELPEGYIEKDDIVGKWEYLVRYSGEPNQETDLSGYIEFYQNSRFLDTTNNIPGLEGETWALYKQYSTGYNLDIGNQKGYITVCCNSLWWQLDTTMYVLGKE